MTLPRALTSRTSITFWPRSRRRSIFRALHICVCPTGPKRRRGSSRLAGLDVLSLYELRDARRLGADGTRLVATGPAKTKAFHRELIGCNALISIDSPEELEDLIGCLPADVAVQPVLLRLRPAQQASSLFGMPTEAVRHCLSRLPAFRGTISPRRQSDSQARGQKQSRVQGPCL